LDSDYHFVVSLRDTDTATATSGSLWNEFCIPHAELGLGYVFGVGWGENPKD
jgi:hypothetical protein